MGMNAACVLGIIHKDEKRKKIEELCKIFGCGFREVAAAEINTPVVKLLMPQSPMNFKPQKTAPAFYVAPELLVFSGLTDGELNRFLDEYKARGIEVVENKGVITPHNFGWSPYELILEYEEERRG